MSVQGTGLLADHLARELDTDATVMVAELGDLTPLLAESTRDGRPVCFVGTWRSTVYVGPIWRPGTAGCPMCLVSRVANSAYGPDRSGDDFSRPARSGRGASVLGPGLFHQILLGVRGGLAGQLLDDGQVLVVDGSAGTAELQVLLPDSTCPTCGETGAGSLPELTGDPLPKSDPGTLRVRRIDPDMITRDYLFPGLGLFKELKQDLQSPFGACSVELPTQWGRREPAIGRATTYRDSRAIAVLEGLERYAGLHRGGGRRTVRASYAELADRALNPLELGVHPEECYRSEGFRYREFHPDTVVDWVEAYSFERDGPVLVPERAAFWGPRHDGETSFFYDTSNGCALGSSVAEAVLHGLREVAERDSFLLTWYRRLAVPEVDLTEVTGPLGDLLRKASLFTGFDLRAFATTMEYGMPSFWLLAENRTGRGPATFAGSGAHPDPVQALIGGLHELVGIILATRHSYEERRPEALRMLEDPALIRRMEDHSLVAALPEARDRFAFLQQRERIPLEEVCATIRRDEPDLRADLDVAVGGLREAGMDVLVVDQTMPELRRNGLTCVRVLVPGLVPMTFGHRNRRTRRLPRLTEGAGLPYPGRLEPDEEVGCVPHPFP
ncbi:TOMM precursor leader peptide-binding protein [Nonomuraea sp. B19D2]|uniref:TOMM precursor leader peptide-binding protein n=1 Tax=Nonomuraea sp. B19D2 TaxID=3159561 RepID=UPI0032DB67EB